MSNCCTFASCTTGVYQACKYQQLQPGPSRTLESLHNLFIPDDHCHAGMQHQHDMAADYTSSIPPRSFQQVASSQRNALPGSFSKVAVQWQSPVRRPSAARPAMFHASPGSQQSQPLARPHLASQGRTLADVRAASASPQPLRAQSVPSRPPQRLSQPMQKPPTYASPAAQHTSVSMPQDSHMATPCTTLRERFSHRDNSVQGMNAGHAMLPPSHLTIQPASHNLRSAACMQQSQLHDDMCDTAVSSEAMLAPESQHATTELRLAHNPALSSCICVIGHEQQNEQPIWPDSAGMAASEPPAASPNLESQSFMMPPAAALTPHASKEPAQACKSSALLQHDALGAEQATAQHEALLAKLTHLSSKCDSLHEAIKSISSTASTQNSKLDGMERELHRALDSMHAMSAKTLALLERQAAQPVRHEMAVQTSMLKQAQPFTGQHDRMQPDKHETHRQEMQQMNHAARLSIENASPAVQHANGNSKPLKSAAMPAAESRHVLKGKQGTSQDSSMALLRFRCSSHCMLVSMPASGHAGP